MDRWRLARACAGLIAALGLSAPTAAHAAPAKAKSPLHWSAPVAVPAPAYGPDRPLESIDCPTAAFCLVGDNHGDVLVTTQPGSGARGYQSVAALASARSYERHAAIDHLTCPSAALCLLGDSHGGIWASSTPAIASSWKEWTDPFFQPGGSLGGLTCASAAACVAVQNEELDDSSTEGAAIAFTSNPLSPTSWLSVGDGDLIDGGTTGPYGNGIACLTALKCYLTDGKGRIVASSNPAKPHGWDKPVKVATRPLGAIACPSFCIAADNHGGLYTSTQPPAHWHTWRVAKTELRSIACPSARLCVAVGAGGTVAVSTAPTRGAAGWAVSTPDTAALTGVSCPTTTLCVATDAAGRVIVGRAAA